jgi:hypothetical protein
MLYLIFIIVGISLVLIVSEIKRPKLSKEEKSKYSKVSEEYRKNGYITYFTSIHTPEFFFVYEDKGTDKNDGKRPYDRIYIDCENENAFISSSLKDSRRKDIDPPIPFDTINV